MIGSYNIIKDSLDAKSNVLQLNNAIASSGVLIIFKLAFARSLLKKLASQTKACRKSDLSLLTHPHKGLKFLSINRSSFLVL
jgi:hypothetical protein